MKLEDAINFLDLTCSLQRVNIKLTPEIKDQAGLIFLESIEEVVSYAKSELNKKMMKKIEEGMK